jgi:hypothetical protein
MANEITAADIFFRLRAADAGVEKTLERMQRESRKTTNVLTFTEHRTSGAFRGMRLSATSNGTLITGVLGRMAAVARLTGASFSTMGRLGILGLTKLMGFMGTAAGFIVAGLKKIMWYAKMAGMMLMVLAGISVKFASDAGEVQSKFDTVFGEESARAVQALNKFGESVGRGRTQLREMAAGIQDTFVPLGFARDTATDLSIAVTKLAVDLASFNNASDPEVMASLQSALIGNHETVRKYGVIISETTLSQQLMNMGIEGGTKAATNQQKVLARLQMIISGTTDAQGDATRTAGSFANQAKGLWATIQDLGILVGNALIPSVLKLMGLVRDGAKYWIAQETLIMAWGKTLASWMQKAVDWVRIFANVLVNWRLAFATIVVGLNLSVAYMRDRWDWLIQNFINYAIWFAFNFHDLMRQTGKNFVSVFARAFAAIPAMFGRMILALRMGQRISLKDMFQDWVEMATSGVKWDLPTLPDAMPFSERRTLGWKLAWQAMILQWRKAMSDMGKSSKKAGEDVETAFDLQALFDQLAAGASSAAGKVNASITSATQMWSARVTARIEEGSNRNAQLQEAMQKDVGKLVGIGNEQNQKLGRIEKNISPVGA